MDPEDLKIELKESKAMSSSGGEHFYGSIKKIIHTYIICIY